MRSDEGRGRRAVTVGRNLWGKDRDDGGGKQEAWRKKENIDT